jgi:hypothetical protein
MRSGIGFIFIYLEEPSCTGATRARHGDSLTRIILGKINTVHFSFSVDLIRALHEYER